MTTNRRRLLRWAAAGGLGLAAGCLADGSSDDTTGRDPTDTSTDAAGTASGSQSTSDTPTDGATERPPCEELPHHPIDVGDHALGQTADGVELTTDAPHAGRGDPVTVRLRNRTDAEQYTGNRRKYAIQRWTGEAWRHVLRVPENFAWTDEAIEHGPGEGFTWDLELSADGLSADAYRVCDALDPGPYRFVYFGVIDGGDPERERALTATVALTADGTRSVEDYAAHAFDHGDLGGPVVEGGLAFDVDSGVPARHVSVVGSTAEAARIRSDRLRRADEDAAAFVDETDFDAASLVVVQRFPASSHPDLRAAGVERTPGAVHLRVDEDDGAATEDVTVETLLVRVADDGDPPAVATVTTADGRTYGGS